jgi:hypothetical protein
MTSDLSQRNHIRIPAGHGDEMDAWLYLPIGPGPTRLWSWLTALVG